MIKPVRKTTGVPRACAICDLCQRTEVFACGYDHRNQPRAGQVIRKATERGWASVKKTLHCPSCVAKRKASEMNSTKTTPKPTKATRATEPDRQPTALHRREINQHLLSFYDVAAGRYTDDATDHTIAGMIGEGCMPGWVAAIRESDYGPDGGNAGMAELDERLAGVEAALTPVVDLVPEVSAMRAELARIRSAVGPHTLRKAGVS